VLDNINELDQQAKMIRKQREQLLIAMRGIPKLEVFPSQANFILFRVLEKNANDIFDDIKQKGVLIKNMKAEAGLLKNCLRVTVGTPAENLAFMGALEAAMTSL
jgi:histidinol-phosphate aminotransferase